jgi:hypothetical protein
MKIATKIETPGTQPYGSPYEEAAYQPAISVKKPATASAIRILSLRASLIESMILGM